MGAAPCFGETPLDSELTSEIIEAVDQATSSIPESYINERHHIIEKMRHAAPGPYEDLHYADYLDKNESSVNALALEKVISKEAKKEIAKKINEQIEPKVDVKTADLNPAARAAVRKAVEKMVEQLIDKAVDEFVKNIDKYNKQTKP
ncbi:unnamed protein product [Adineta steineri]|uniref:Uncharacterized protein n=1 Tax=Adineta steineri TaxID=433720 RepID=A0A813QZY8_9BILA|nr:unnamed protein product [Adineta steineri]CAF0906458.1 unnamed protein product [Adineta steineri]CAF1116262.1 unnamed protein product [Adineta steineri]